MWKDNTPDMMTEEETAGEEEYIRHQPDWRSTHFNSFTRKLDSRLSKTVKCSLAKTRTNGDCVSRTPPKRAKTWMLADQENEDPNGAAGDESADSTSLTDAETD